jgi:hypothetical protein
MVASRLSRSPDMVTIFKLSPVNGAHYDGELLPPQHWNWPSSTWLKRRMAQIDEFRLTKSPTPVAESANEKIREAFPVNRM